VLTLAHQGGWDEALFVAVPLVVFALLLRAAKRRAEREAGEARTRPSDGEPSDPAATRPGEPG
jgi:hypothetical protein